MPATEPRVSVVIPTYNRHEYVGQAVESVLAQPYEDFEVIVVDDGSADGTRTLLRRFADPRVRYFYQDNAGRSTARNAGIQISRGRYISFLDDDDLCLPSRLVYQVGLLESRPEIGLVAGGWLCIDENGRLLKEVRPWLWRPALDTRTWLFACPASPGTVTVRKAWLENAGGFDEGIGAHAEDWDLFLRLAHIGCQMAWVEEIVCAYRVHAGNTIHHARRQRDGMLLVLDKFFADPGLPSDLRTMKDHVYARAYLRGAAREYGVGQTEEGRQDVSAAIRLEPGLLADDAARLCGTLIAWAGDSATGDPIQYTRTVFGNLPDVAVSMKRRMGEALAIAAKQSLFDAHFRKDRRGVIRSLRVMAANSPKTLRDLGVLSVLVEAILGHAAMSAIRRVVGRA